MKRSSVESGAEHQETSTEEFSEDLRDEQASLPEQEIETRIARMIDEAVERRFQSAKDKRWAELERQYGLLSELAAQTQAQGDELPPEVDPEPEAGYQKLLTDLAAVMLKQTEPLADLDPGAFSQPLGGAPENDLQAAYETLKRQLRPGDVQGLTALKRQFREKGLQIF